MQETTLYSSQGSSQIRKSLFVSNETIDDIEDEDGIYASIPRIQTDDFHLVQASKEYVDANQVISSNPWDYAAWHTYIDEVRLNLPI